MDQARAGEGTVEWASQISGTGWMTIRATGENRSGTVAEGLVLVMWALRDLSDILWRPEGSVLESLWTWQGGRDIHSAGPLSGF